jgi:predicted nucleic acid binding AN1-type Zn finger protein
LDESSQSGEDNVRIAMSLVEAIGKAQVEYNACVKRQQDITNSLKEKRSDRLSKQLKDNASILNLVQLWKLEETRNKMIKLAQLQKVSIKEEVERLMTMDELKGKIMGLSRNEALNG